MTSSLLRLARTVRHLRPVQVYARAWFRLCRPRPDLRVAPPIRQLRSTYVLPARRAASLTGASRFRFLNREGDVSLLGWDDPGVDKLWRYNLHYFEDLNAHDAAVRGEAHRALLEQWIRDNPPGQGTGWEPYPISLRLVNWIKWILAGNAPGQQMLDSLAVQARWLRQRLEHHLLGNHLFANLKALAFAGAFFQGYEADAWLAYAMRLLARELDEQILADGGQFERSPMYHALALEDVLDLANLLHGFGLEPAAMAVLRARAPAMLHWLRVMSHPDGELAQFNDSAPGVAPDNRELERYARELGIAADAVAGDGRWHLRDSGYVRIARDGAVALVDVAPVGPDYLPGHAHADSLSMEFSVGARRVIVNGGTSCYGTGPRRLQERGTASHSTVQVADRDSSEVWSGFRVGRRARIRDVRIHDDLIEAAHDGYRFLPGAPLHRRRWEFASRSMLVVDRVAPIPAKAVARFHLAPGLEFVQQADDRFAILDAGREIAAARVGQGMAAVRETLRAPAFGVLVPAATLEVELANGAAETRWTW